MYIDKYRAMYRCITNICLEIDCSELLKSLILKVISIIWKTCNITKVNTLYLDLTICGQLMDMTSFELEALRYMQVLMHSHVMCYESMWKQQIIWRSMWPDNIWCQWQCKSLKFIPMYYTLIVVLKSYFVLIFIWPSVVQQKQMSILKNNTSMKQVQQISKLRHGDLNLQRVRHFVDV